MQTDVIRAAGAPPHDTATARSAKALAPGFLAGTDRRALVLFLGALFAARALAMAVIPFTDTTEARYAEIARKMVESGDWITPWFDHAVPFWGKPPLHTWLSAGGMALFGVGELGGRIPIFAASCALLLLIHRWLARERGPDVALASVAVLAGSALFAVASAVVMTDMAMAAGTTMAMIGFWTLAARDERRIEAALLLFGGLAAGLLAKGPVAVVLTAGPIGAWVLLGRRWHALRRTPWVWGLALTALLAAPWYLAAEIRTPGFLRYFLIGEHVERFLVPGWKGDLYGSGHDEAKGTIWLFWLLAFLPWPLVALRLVGRTGALAAAFRADAEGWRSYLLLWAVAPMALFTPAANILIPYVLPGLPAAAILLVTLWRDRWPGPVDAQTRRWFGVAGGAALAGYVAASLLGAAAPQLVASKSQKALVEAARAIAPEATLNVYGRRSHSAEFYTAGRTIRRADVEALRAMLDDGAPDALSIGTAAIAELPHDISARLHTVGTFGRRTLLIERETTR